ncbi:hypothetical protein [Alloacidobacterium sp.]|uniref:hypothetical protein n=1 Tax=Alloacidobacterium sp. TaxID=2951999 RepID=UPI002D34BB84|nr:hypothetical protein [Alloacidobacterium sp.]HYK36918.1 hypothetical protein [Alloacidobacterium sp.]
MILLLLIALYHPPIDRDRALREIEEIRIGLHIYIQDRSHAASEQDEIADIARDLKQLDHSDFQTDETFFDELHQLERDWNQLVATDRSLSLGLDAI